MGWEKLVEALDELKTKLEYGQKTWLESYPNLQDQRSPLFHIMFNCLMDYNRLLTVLGKN